jgi:predicted transcriptional regulator
MGTPAKITRIYVSRLKHLSILTPPGGTGMERAMADVESKDQAREKELSELSSRLRGVAEAMRRLTGDQPGIQERLQELKDEVDSVRSLLRRFS